MYCYNCGYKVSKGDNFCQNCGAKVIDPSAVTANKNLTSPKTKESISQKKEIQNDKKENSGASVRYVYVDKNTGKIADNPAVKSGTESVAKWMTVIFIIIAVIIVMISGSMFISGHMLKSVFYGNAGTSSDTAAEISSSYNISSDPVTSNSVSSSEVSSIPPELLAENIKSKIKGEWYSDIPYKSMTIPATFSFDDNGKCRCSLKALFISKNFEGSYTVNDGGRCSVTLMGLEEYVGGSNTMVGDVKFISDDLMTFTVGDTVWSLNRVQ